MRRSILIALSATALAGAMAIGPFGAAAAAPYVYGCTPAMFLIYGTQTFAIFSVYNGSASAANLTLKILAGNGHILNPTAPFGVPLTYSLTATHTAFFQYNSPSGGPNPAEVNGTQPASIRVVSNVPVAATLNLLKWSDTDVGNVHIDDCASLQP